MSFTILNNKDGANPGKPLFLVSIVSPDGDTVYLTRANYYGAANLTYNGNTYLSRIVSNDIDSLQAISPQGYGSVPGFSMTLADADKFLWTNHCLPHGWRGAVVTLTVVLWDIPTNAYSTDALQWTFIGGNPQHNHAQGQTTLDVAASTNFARLKVPSFPLEYRCPFDFPVTAADRAAALNDPTSLFYQCGYSYGVAGGVGNPDSTGAAFVACDFTRSGGTDVGCMARLGNAATVSVAPDGDLEHDKAGNYTARFGGVTWSAPTTYQGHEYLTGNKVFGYNQPNTALPGTFYNHVIGTQWVSCAVLAPAADPNSVRFEAVVCDALYGPANILQLVVNGVEVPQNGSDKLFLWRYINQGGRSGALNRDAIFDGHGDPHGSVCCIEVVVPISLVSAGSIPSCAALVTGPPILNVYAIASVTGGVVTFTGPNFSCAGNPPFTVVIKGNSNPALNGAFELTSWAGGNPGTITLSGSTASGTGGAVFFYAPPDLLDTGGDIASNPTGQYANTAGPAANNVWAVLDLMSMGNIDLAQIDPVSWYNAAQVAALPVSYVAADGSTQTHAQYKTSFALNGTQQQVLGQVITAVRNAGNLMVGQSSTTGLIQAFVKQTLADQQPAPVPGSNDTTPRASKKADGTSANGYYAYVFDESNIDKGSFKITTTAIASTPNVVSFQFQDEQNGYSVDSITEIDPTSYAFSGNQEIAAPVPITGIPNFDQGLRVSNVQLAEALFGNARNDAGGTIYFEFKTNQRVLHLAGQLGFICGLNWQDLSIGGATPQAVRIITLKPDTDGEHWQVKCAFHVDDWYTFAYGQNPAPFHINPLTAPPSRPPYPWRPGVTEWGSSDALFPGQLGFDFGVDVSSYPAKLSISGNLPVNAQQSTRAPLIPMQSATGNTGGHLAPGTYLVAISANGVVGPVSLFTTAVVPTGTSTNTVTVSGVQWRSGAAPAPSVFMGTSSMNMRALAPADFVGSSPDANGNPTVFTINRLTVDGLGLPDVVAAEFLVEELDIIHGGVWGDVVFGVSGSTLTFPEATWTSGQWNGYTLSLYYRAGVAVQPALNIPVAVSTTNTLLMTSAGFELGDIVVMRAKAGHITANTIGDDNFENFYAPGGLTVDAEAGNLVQIIAGTGAGYPPKSIASNTSKVLTINGEWDVTPDATTRYVVIGPGVEYSTVTSAFSNDGTAPVSLIATTKAVTKDAQALMVYVSTADSDGKTSPRQYQPFREVYIPAQGSALLPAPTPQFLSVSASAEWSTTNPGNVDITAFLTPPATLGTTLGTHFRLEVPDQSSSDPISLGAWTLGDTAVTQGPWSLADGPKKQFIDAQTPLVFSVPSSVLWPTGVITGENVRLYAPAYSASYDTPVTQANQANPTPSVVFSIGPQVIRKPDSGASITPTQGASIDATGSFDTPALDNVMIGGQLWTPIRVNTAIEPNAPSNWGYQIQAFLDGDLTTQPVAVSPAVAVGGIVPSDGSIPVAAASPGDPAARKGATGGHGVVGAAIPSYTFGTPTPNTEQFWTLYMVAGMFVFGGMPSNGHGTVGGAGTAVAPSTTRFIPNLIVPGITPSVVIQVGTAAGTLDMAAYQQGTQLPGPGVQLGPGVTTDGDDNVVVQTGAGASLNGDGDLVVNVGGAVAIDGSNNVVVQTGSGITQVGDKVVISLAATPGMKLNGAEQLLLQTAAGVTVNGSGDLVVTPGPGVTFSGNNVVVQAGTTSGVNIDGSGNVVVKAGTSNGVTFDGSGNVILKTSLGGIAFDGSGHAIVQVTGTAGTAVDGSGNLFVKTAGAAGVGFDGSGNVAFKAGQGLTFDGSGNAKTRVDGTTVTFDAFGNQIVGTIQTANLAAGSLGDLTKYGSTVRAIGIVFSLPPLPDSTHYPAGSMIVNLGDGAIYRTSSGSTWDSSTRPADIIAGTIAAAVTMLAPSLQITSGSSVINIDGTNFIKITQGGITPRTASLTSSSFQMTATGSQGVALGVGGLSIEDASGNTMILTPTSFALPGKMNFEGPTAVTASTSTRTLPASPDGFIQVLIGGNARVLPYYLP